MSKDEKKGPPDGPIEVAVVKRGSMYHVVMRARVNGKVEESEFKKTDSKLIAADRVSQALLGSGL